MTKARASTPDNSAGIASATRALLCVLAFVVAAFPAMAEVPWVAEGGLSNVLHVDGERLLYAGSVQRIGPLTGPLISLDDGVVAASFPDIIGVIHDVRADPRGGYYVGGSFVVDSDVAISNLARIDPDGRLDMDWAPNPNGAVTTIEINAAGVFIGGNFDQVAGQPRGAVAKFSPDGELENWAIELRNVSRIITADVGLLIAHDAYYRGRARNSAGVIGVSTQSSARVTWRSGLQYAAAVRDIAVSGDRLFMCGRFDSLQAANNTSFTRPGLAVLQMSSGQVLDVDIRLGDQQSVAACALHQDKLYIAGSFTHVNGERRDRLAELDLDGNVTDWVPPVIEGGRHLSLQVIEDELYVLGDLRGYASWLGGLNGYAIDSGKHRPLPIIDAPVKALSFDDSGTMVIGGEFTRVGDADRRFLAFLNDQAQLLPQTANLDGPVTNAWHAGNRLWVTGTFNGADRFWCPGLVVLNMQGELEWCPENNGVVHAVVEYGDYLVIAGNFTEFAGESVQGMVFLQADMTLSGKAPRLNTTELGVAILDAVVHGDRLIFIQRLYAGSGFSEQLVAVRADGERQGLPTPGVVSMSRLILDGDRLAVIGPRGSVELNLATDASTPIPVENGSIYLHPSFVGAKVEGRYIIAAERNIGGGDLHAVTSGKGADALVDSLSLAQPVYALKRHADTLWVASDPGRSRLLPASGVLRINLPTKTLSAAPGLDAMGDVQAVATSGTTQVYAGNSSSYLAREGGALMLTDLNGVPDQRWQTTDHYTAVSSADYHDGVVYLCARRDNRQVVAAIDMVTTETLWQRRITPSQPNRCRIKVHRDRLYLGGIRSLEDTSTSLAVLDWQGQLVESDLVDGDVRSINVSDGRLFIAGHFTHFRGMARTGFVEIDAAGQLSPWTTDAVPSREFIQAVIPLGDMYVILGGFNMEVAGQHFSNIVAVDRAGTMLDWRPDRHFSSSFTAATRVGDLLIVAGYFDSTWEHESDFREREHRPHYGIAAIDVSGRVLDWNPGVYKKVASDLLVVDGRLYAAWSGMGRHAGSFFRDQGILRTTATLGPIALPVASQMEGGR